MTSDSCRQLRQILRRHEGINCSSMSAAPPVRPVTELLARNGGPRPAAFRADVQSDRVGEANAVEAEVTAKEADDLLRCLVELRCTMNAERATVCGRCSRLSGSG